MKKKADTDPWKIIVGLIILILCAYFIITFFVNKSETGTKNLDFDCLKLSIPGQCVCDDIADCADSVSKETCREEKVRLCNEK